jgi:hypothetical protein
VRPARAETRPEESETRKDETVGEPVVTPPQDKKTTRPPARPKKVISRKKAGRQARLIIVTSPKEEAEMVDVKAGPKKRGRPRKNPTLDPPDPHKGSVSHPGKGGCADPVNEDAILEGVGGKPPGRGGKRQLASDTGDGKT